jgi:hypothetical protein
MQAHQRLALAGLFVANAKAVRLNIPLFEEGAWGGDRRVFMDLHHWFSPSSAGRVVVPVPSAAVAALTNAVKRGPTR